MKHRRKGRKLYTYHARNRHVFHRNHPMRSAFSTVVMLVLAVGLVFVGYNYIGPIVERVHQEAEHPTTTPEPYYTDDIQQLSAETQPADASAETTAATTVTTVTTTETTVTTTTTTEAIPARFEPDVKAAYLADADVLQNLDTLDATAKKASENGFTALILPVKDDTGKLLYASEVQKAKDCGAASGAALSAREIRNAVGRYHLDCIALMSTLKDQTYPNVFMDGSYTFKEGSTRWLDNKPSEGGKPWLSPFEPAAKDYLSAIAEELDQAGFAQIICKDTVFPNFFRSDAELLGNKIEDKQQRKAALVSVLNEMTAASPNVYPFVDLQGISEGKEEAFDVSALKTKYAVIRIDPDMQNPFVVNEHRYDPSSLQGTEKLMVLIRAAKDAAGQMNMIPCIIDHGMTDFEVEETVTALHDEGLTTVFFVKAEKETEQADADSEADDT